MRFVIFLKEEIEKPTKEMFDFFYKRTKEHIDRVAKNISTIAEERDDINKVELMARAKTHDKSKYSKEEFIPYVWLTWWFKEKNEGRDFKYPDGIKEKTREASKSHVENNRHHPEYFENPEDVSDIDIAEMIADWAAMSQELDNSLREWADKNVGKKWKFNKKQVKLIYDLIELFE
jgi:hypothetical protein